MNTTALRRTVPRRASVNVPKDTEPVCLELAGARSGRTQEQELPAVSVELPQVDAELVDGGAVAVLVEQSGKLLDLLRGQFGPQLKGEQDKKINACEKKKKKIHQFIIHSFSSSGVDVLLSCSPAAAQQPWC